jgi:general secretion pathway protein J
MKARRSSSAARRRGVAGFTLFEALVSVALMGLIVASLSVVTGQWLPNWHRGFGRTQSIQSFDVGLQRVVADLEAAEFVTANGLTKLPLFIGDAASVTLVRAAIGPNAPPHLELINLAETRDERGVALARTRAPFTPFSPDRPVALQLRLADPVALIRAPFLVSFAFAGPDRQWRDSWRDAAQLPNAIRVQVRDAATSQILALSTATLLHVDLPAECVGQKSVQQCLAGISAPAAAPPAAKTDGSVK